MTGGNVTMRCAPDKLADVETRNRVLTAVRLGSLETQ